MIQEKTIGAIVILSICSFIFFITFCLWHFPFVESQKDTLVMSKTFIVEMVITFVVLFVCLVLFLENTIVGISEVILGSTLGRVFKIFALIFILFISATGTVGYVLQCSRSNPHFIENIVEKFDAFSTKMFGETFALIFYDVLFGLPSLLIIFATMILTFITGLIGIALVMLVMMGFSDVVEKISP